MVGRFGFVPRRILASVPLLVGVVLLVFLILQVTPGDPARLVVGLRASDAELDAARSELGLDRPVVVQFAHYLGGVATGDLGFSFKSHQPVTEIIADRVPASLWLLSTGAVLSVILSVAIAVGVSQRPNGVGDHVARVAGIALFAMPSFWIGILLVMSVALPTGWFPVGGFGDSFAERCRSIVLPAITLAAAMVPLQVRSLRASLIQVRRSEYVVVARSLGISPWRVNTRFILRNALVPTVSMLALNIGYMLFGAVVIETTFALPGIGQGLVLAAQQRDIPLIQGYTLVFAVAVVVVYLVADVVSSLLDPRISVTS